MKGTVLVVLIGLLAGVEVVDAQRPSEEDRTTRGEARERAGSWSPAALAFGARGIYDFDASDFGLGMHVQIPAGLLLRVVPSAEVYFGDETTWQANADALVSLLLFRAGGGVAIVDGARTGIGTDGAELGLNLFVGVQSPRFRTRFRPYVDARWTFVDEQTWFRLVAGVNVPIGARR